MLVVGRCGMPLGYELFAGNKADVSSVQEVVTKMEERYGQADRIWAMDRGMVSRANIEFLKEGGRRYIVGTPKSMLKRYEKWTWCCPPATASTSANAASTGLANTRPSSSINSA